MHFKPKVFDSLDGPPTDCSYRNVYICDTCITAKPEYKSLFPANRYLHDDNMRHVPCDTELFFRSKLAEAENEQLRLRNLTEFDWMVPQMPESLLKAWPTRDQVPPDPLSTMAAQYAAAVIAAEGRVEFAERHVAGFARVAQQAKSYGAALLLAQQKIDAKWAMERDINSEAKSKITQRNAERAF